MGLPFGNMLISIPAMILSRFIDISTPEKLNFWRLIYIIVLVISAAIYYYISTLVQARGDKRKIWIERKMLGVTDIEETTYEEHEMKICQAQMSAPLQGGLMTLGLMSFYLNLHYGFLMQIIMSPINLLRNPLVKKYIFGMTLDHPYDEVTECPPSKMSVEEAKKAVVTCIQSTWDQYEYANYEKLEQLMQAANEYNPKTSVFCSFLVSSVGGLDSLHGTDGQHHGQHRVCGQVHQVGMRLHAEGQRWRHRSSLGRLSQ